MEDDLKKNKKNEDDQKKNGKRPKKKWKRNQSTKINLIGCDTIVNSPIITLIIVFPLVVIMWFLLIAIYLILAFNCPTFAC